MPVEVTPLFRRDVLRPHLAGFTLPERAQSARAKLREWADLFGTAKGLELKETELLPEWLTDVFHGLLGYTGPTALASEGRYTISRERLVDAEGEFADAVIGDFREGEILFVAALEGKGPMDPLDRPFSGRRLSAVEQAYRYATNLPCDWIVVTNLREIRLYYKSATQRTYERFAIADLANDEDELKRLVYLLGAERMAPREGRCHLYSLLEESERAGEEVTQKYYGEYARIRREMLGALLSANPESAPALVLSATQRLLDRALFIAFAEDRSLLPTDTLLKAYSHSDPYNPRPIWQNFLGLFRAIDQGGASLGIPKYNGGLFACDQLLDEGLNVPDAACALLKRLGEYNYAQNGNGDATSPVVDVEILGHIFEQSIEDLEGLRAELEGGEATRQTSKRKREGAFYTPRSITAYIVREALEPVLTDRFEKLRRKHHASAKGTQKKALEDPVVFDTGALNQPQRQALIAFWEAWLEELKTIRIIDPACGSGAFLIEAFDQLHRIYTDVVERLVDLDETGQRSLFEPDRTILQNNLYGVDLNEEAIEIARLSIWIKTAQRDKVLTDLDHNIRIGNSIVSNPELDPRAIDWQVAFPEVMAQGGFDVVIGNPPYVRAELLTPIKEHLEERFSSYHGQADLYVYFYELGVKLLRPGGQMSYIVTNKWFKAAYGEPLRRFFAEETWVESIIDLGHARQIFPDADVFPCIVRVKKAVGKSAPATTRVSRIPRDLLKTDDLKTMIEAFAFDFPRADLSGGVWTLEPPELEDIFSKMRRVAPPLREYAGRSPVYGIKTGYNEAYLLTSAERDAIIRDDPACTDIIRPYLRGQDIRRWTPEWAGLWMIVMRSSANYDWPWKEAGPDAEEIFSRTCPALYRHFKMHEERLRRRSDQGTYWWELRSCDYYDRFEGPKIIWKDLSFHPEFAFDTTGIYTNDLCFFIPSDDLWLIAVLNSPLLWAYLWRNTIHGKDEVLRLKTIYMEATPIAVPTSPVRAAAEDYVRDLIEIARERREIIDGMLDWLHSEFGIDKPGNALTESYNLTTDAFVDEVKKRRPGRSTVTSAELRRLREEYDGTVPGLRALNSRATEIEMELSDLVFEAYGLSEEEMSVIWRTAPPRMPAGRQIQASAGA